MKIHLILPQTSICSGQKIILTAANIFQITQRYLVLSILGMPLCHDHINDACWQLWLHCRSFNTFIARAKIQDKKV